MFIKIKAMIVGIYKFIFFASILYLVYSIYGYFGKNEWVNNDKKYITEIFPLKELTQSVCAESKYFTYKTVEKKVDIKCYSSYIGGEFKRISVNRKDFDAAVLQFNKEISGKN